MFLFNKIHEYLFFVCCIVVFAGCTKDSGKENNKQSNLVYKEIHDVAYGASGEQKFDVYLPAGRNAATKVIVMIHGGGWTFGDKSDNAPMINYFINKGYAVINMNYRLVKMLQDKFPAQMDDVRTVINTVLSKKSEYAISDKLALMGISAGAHLSLLYAYAYNEGNYVKAVATIVGPTNFEAVAQSTNTLLKNDISYLLGATYQANPQLWKNASPYWKAASGSTPTIIFTGSADELVEPYQSQVLADKLSALGVPNNLTVYPNENHVFVNPLNWLNMEQKIDNWFKVYVK